MNRQVVNTTLHADVLVSFRCPEELFKHLTTIWRVRRPSNAKMDAWHSQQALERMLDPDRARVGRVRKGRVDTGDPIAEIRRLARLDFSSLERQHFRLISVHGYWDSRQYGRGRKVREVRRFVVRATFTAAVDDTPALSENDDVRIVLESLAEVSTWGTCWVWDNFDNTSIVFAGSMKDDSQKILAVEGRSLVIKDANESAQEGEDSPA